MDMIVISSQLFEFGDVTGFLVGIPPMYLNQFLQRKLYGITALISGRRGERNSRRFDEATVFGIALAWMLFKGGFRTETIRRILNDIAETSKADAVAAAQVLLVAQVPYLVIIHELAIDGDEPATEIRTAGTHFEEDIAKLRVENPTAMVDTLPVGLMFDAIEQRMSLIREVRAKRTLPAQ
jgi:hypothetical protein